jgi:hypothetical protein
MTAETVKLTLEVPKGIIDFVMDLFKFSGEEQSIEEFLTDELVGSVKSILHDLPNTWFDVDKILERYGLADTAESAAPTE